MGLGFGLDLDPHDVFPAKGAILHEFDFPRTRFEQETLRRIAFKVPENVNSCQLTIYMYRVSQASNKFCDRNSFFVTLRQNWPFKRVFQPIIRPNLIRD